MEVSNKNNTYNTLNKWQNFRLKLILESIIVGLLAGLVVVFYRIAIQKAEFFSKKAYALQLQNPYLIPIWIIFLIVIAYFVGNMVKKDFMISGSGIPQIQGVLKGYLSMNWWSVVLKKFIGGVLAIGAGLSLGREGPSIQLGAAVGQGVGKIFKRIKLEEKFLITAGASSGLAAAFNAPFAGVIFSLEEIHKNFSPLVILSAMSASITADFVSKEFFGLKPIFHFDDIMSIPLHDYLYIIILGIILGALGAFYNYILLKTQKLYVKCKWLPVQLRPVIPFVLAGILGLIMPQVLGGGHEIVVSITNENFLIKTLIIILIVKFVFSMISFGSGAPGGIFFPLLVIGALIGAIYGDILIYLFNFDKTFMKNFIILGMAGYFTAIVRAPITGVILITEMTGSFNHLLSLTVVSIVAYIVADMLGSKPVYESLLERILQNKSNIKVHEDKGVKTIIETVVHHGSYVEDKKIKDLNWPNECLLVAVKRGHKEIIPKGNTNILAGDYLIVLTNEQDATKVRNILFEMSERVYKGCLEPIN